MTIKNNNPVIVDEYIHNWSQRRLYEENSEVKLESTVAALWRRFLNRIEEVFQKREPENSTKIADHQRTLLNRLGIPKDRQQEVSSYFRSLYHEDFNIIARGGGGGDKVTTGEDGGGDKVTTGEDGGGDKVTTGGGGRVGEEEGGRGRVGENITNQTTNEELATMATDQLATHFNNVDHILQMQSFLEFVKSNQSTELLTKSIELCDKIINLNNTNNTNTEFINYLKLKRSILQTINGRSFNETDFINGINTLDSYDLKYIVENKHKFNNLYSKLIALTTRNPLNLDYLKPLSSITKSMKYLGKAGMTALNISKHFVPPLIVESIKYVTQNPITSVLTFYEIKDTVKDISPNINFFITLLSEVNSFPKQPNDTQVFNFCGKTVQSAPFLCTYALDKDNLNTTTSFINHAQDYFWLGQPDENSQESQIPSIIYTAAGVALVCIGLYQGLTIYRAEFNEELYKTKRQAHLESIIVSSQTED